MNEHTNEHVGVKRRTYFTIISNHVLSDQRVTQKALLVYLAIAKHANNDSGTAFPSYETIAKFARMSRRSAIDGLRELEDLGYVTKKAAMKYSINGKVSQAANTYTLQDETPESIGNAFPKSRTEEVGRVESEDDAGVVQDVHHPSAPAAPPLVQDVHPNYTHPEQDSKKGGGETPPPPLDSENGETLSRDDIADLAAVYGFASLDADSKALDATQRLVAQHGAETVRAALAAFYDAQSKRKKGAPLHWFVSQFSEHKATADKIAAERKAREFVPNVPKETDFARVMRLKAEQDAMPREEALAEIAKIRAAIGGAA